MYKKTPALLEGEFVSCAFHKGLLTSLTFLFYSMKELCFEQLAFHNGSVLNSFMKLKQKVCFAFSKNGTFALEKAKVPELRQSISILIDREFSKKNFRVSQRESSWQKKTSSPLSIEMYISLSFFTFIKKRNFRVSQRKSSCDT